MCFLDPLVAFFCCWGLRADVASLGGGMNSGTRNRAGEDGHGTPQYLCAYHGRRWNYTGCMRLQADRLFWSRRVLALR